VVSAKWRAAYTPEAAANPIAITMIHHRCLTQKSTTRVMVDVSMPVGACARETARYRPPSMTLRQAGRRPLTFSRRHPAIALSS
jgi:hypothetical protein